MQDFAMAGQISMIDTVSKDFTRYSAAGPVQPRLKSCNVANE
jgi:hypothetical protein